LSISGLVIGGDIYDDLNADYVKENTVEIYTPGMNIFFFAAELFFGQQKIPILTEFHCT
jgi:hypothetical protein